MFTLWMHGRQIGETRFEHRPTPRKRVGLFQPTAFGLTVLPGITGLFPALLDFTAACRRQGIDVDDDSPENASAALEALGGTPEGRRVAAAVRQVAQLELRDPSGRVLRWESLAISDVNELAARAERRRTGDGSASHPLPSQHHDPVSFLISVTLARHTSARSRRGTGTLHGQPKPPMPC